MEIKLYIFTLSAIRDYAIIQVYEKLKSYLAESFLGTFLSVMIFFYDYSKYDDIYSYNFELNRGSCNLNCTMLKISIIN